MDITEIRHDFAPDYGSGPVRGYRPLDEIEAYLTWQRVRDLRADARQPSEWEVAHPADAVALILESSPSIRPAAHDEYGRIAINGYCLSTHHDGTVLVSYRHACEGTSQLDVRLNRGVYLYLYAERLLEENWYLTARDFTAPHPALVASPRPPTPFI